MGALSLFLGIGDHHWSTRETPAGYNSSFPCFIVLLVIMVLSKSEGAGAETATEVKKVNVGVAMDNVAVHPLVLLSVVDHYNRVA